MCNTFVEDAYKFNISNFPNLIKQIFECDQKNKAIKCEMALVDIENAILETLNFGKDHAAKLF